MTLHLIKKRSKYFSGRKTVCDPVNTSDCLLKKFKLLKIFNSRRLIICLTEVREKKENRK